MIVILIAQLASMVGGLYLLKDDDTEWSCISEWNLSQKIVCLTFVFLMSGMVGTAGWLGLGAENLEQFGRSGASVMHGSGNIRGPGQSCSVDDQQK